MELLTGKCKEDFEYFFYNKYSKSLFDYSNTPKNKLKKYFGWFYDLEMSFKYGVYVDFFDSVGLNILITVEFDFGYIITENRYEEVEEVKKWYDTRQESQLEAIKKANELYNKNPNIK